LLKDNKVLADQTIKNMIKEMEGHSSHFFPSLSLSLDFLFLPCLGFCRGGPSGETRRGKGSIFSLTKGRLSKAQLVHHSRVIMEMNLKKKNHFQSFVTPQKTPFDLTAKSPGNRRIQLLQKPLIPLILPAIIGFFRPNPHL